MAVTVQGYLALDLVKKNNVELVKGVDRASTTTVSALRTAVTVAQAMTNQKLVLEQITALNTTTAGHDRFDRRDAAHPDRRDPRAGGVARPSRWRRCSARSRTSTTRWTRSTSSSSQALGNMKQTVDTLGNEVEKSKGYIARAEGVAQGKLEGAGLAVHADREQMTDVTDKVERAIARFDRVTRQLDERDGPARDAARRERQRLNAGLGRTAASASASRVGADQHRRPSSSA